MKKSAVEWFYNEQKELIKQSELTEMKPSEFDDKVTKLLEQGKEMEKQQQGYSEEEVIELLQKYRFDLSSNKTSNLGDTTKQWFEQLKKK
jgi:hypothetical protein